MLLKYADEEMTNYLQPPVEPELQGDREQAVPPKRHKFKYIDGIERLKDIPLPFLVDLPTGSSEGIFCVAANNSGCGMVPILEWCNGRRAVLDKDGGNGVFLASHDVRIKAKF